MSGLEHVHIPRIETSLLQLRPWYASDIEEFARISYDPEVMRYLGCGLKYRIKTMCGSHVARVSNVESRLAIRRLLRHWQKCGFGEWAVEEKATGQLIGWIGLSHHPDWLEDPAKIEVGWLLARHAWGRGFATEGAKASLRYAFDHLKLERLVSITSIDNLRSQSVMQRIGLVCVGKTHWKGSDVVWYAMDRASWQRRRERIAHRSPGCP